MPELFLGLIRRKSARLMFDMLLEPDIKPS
jgi:hypothetical protein